jgi:acetyl-CoA carboxylase carboxyl transferase subunit alpha
MTDVSVPVAPAVALQPVAAEDARERVWARVQLARNVKRPHTLELVGLLATDVVELHGDRLFRDDPALVGGFARLDGRSIVFVGHQKGAEVEENVYRNFGMPHPEGYRKAMRLFELAERFRLPAVTFVDTPGAFPGPAAEERGVAEAIARSIARMTSLEVPVVTVITGEGGSGGALAIAVGDVVIALENAIYSVISPEGCASILWRDPERAAEAAVAMRLTAADQQELGVVDHVVEEPGEGAHTDHAGTAARLRPVIAAQLDALSTLPIAALLEGRHARYRRMGAFVETPTGATSRPERRRISDRLRDLLERRGPGTEGPGGGAPASAAQPPEALPLDEEL